MASKLSALTGPLSAFLIACSIFYGCSSASPINDWVRHRGYSFYSDYSTINPIGSSVDEQGQLMPYPGIVLGGTTRGEMPNLEKTEERKFVVEGSANVEKFLQALVGSAFTGDFSSISTAEVTLNEPFKEEAQTIFPQGSCDGSKFQIVTSVLNTGDMHIVLKDTKNENITTKFKIAEGGQAQAGAKIHSDNSLTMHGRNFYIGYKTKTFVCKKVRERTVVLPRGKDIYDDIGLYASMVAYRKEGLVGEALVMMSTSNLSAKALDLADKFVKIIELQSNLAKGYQALSQDAAEATVHVTEAQSIAGDQAVEIRDLADARTLISEVKAEAEEGQKRTTSWDPWQKAFHSPAGKPAVPIVVVDPPNAQLAWGYSSWGYLWPPKESIREAKNDYQALAEKPLRRRVT